MIVFYQTSNCCHCFCSLDRLILELSFRSRKAEMTSLLRSCTNTRVGIPLSLSLLEYELESAKIVLTLPDQSRRTTTFYC